MTDQLQGVARSVVEQGGQYGCLIVIAGPSGTKTIPYIGPGQDPTQTAEQLLMAHYDHIRRSAERLGLDIDVREIATETAEQYADDLEERKKRDRGE